MAAIVVTSLSLPAYCQRLERFSRAELLKMGLDGSGLAVTDAEATLGCTPDSIAKQALMMALDGYTTVRIQGTTDTNTADSVALDLGDFGVTFADATVRRLEAVAVVADDNGMGQVSNRAVVDGGSTVILSDTDLDAALDDGLAGAPVPAFALNAGSDAVEYNAIGLTDVDFRWEIEIKIYPASALPYLATT